MIDKLATMFRPVAAIGRQKISYVPLLLLVVAADFALGILNPILAHVYNPTTVFQASEKPISSLTNVALKQAPSYYEIGANGEKPVNGLEVMRNYTCHSLAQDCTLTKNAAGLCIVYPEALEELPFNTSQLVAPYSVDDIVYPSFTRQWGNIKVQPLGEGGQYLLDLVFDELSHHTLWERMSSDRRVWEKIVLKERGSDNPTEDINNILMDIRNGGINRHYDHPYRLHPAVYNEEISGMPISYMLSPAWRSDPNWNHSAIATVLFQADDTPQNFTFLIEIEIKQSSIYTVDSFEEIDYNILESYYPAHLNRTVSSGQFKETCSKISNGSLTVNNTVSYMRMFSDVDSFGIAMAQLVQYPTTRSQVGIGLDTLEAVGRVRAFKRPESCKPENVDVELNEPYFNFIAAVNGSDPKACARFQTLAFDTVTKSRTWLSRQVPILKEPYSMQLQPFASLFGNTSDIPGLLASFATNTFLEGAISLQGHHIVQVTGVILDISFWGGLGALLALSLVIVLVSWFITTPYYRCSLYTALRLTVAGDNTAKAELGLRVDSKDGNSASLTIDGMDIACVDASSENANDDTDSVTLVKEGYTPLEKM
ncbi:hypothetical protein EC973_000474 [Apophysomyces ossiformis]|uniref:Uncharacterized protein n=1 Tax=Apophysomyces ossiformis TaxID=679940 RepID=A0A8H7BKW5_9FUNG|nr:hypothetical protein EC973_000474 [Apophysomyces ossiformis]